MATLVLGAVGSAIGGAVGGSAFGVASAAIGKAVGASVGQVIDAKLLGQGSQTVQRGQIESIRLQNTGYGAPVPRVFGAMRVAGQMIWSSDFLETLSTETSGGGKGGLGPTVTTETYSYSVSCAFALGQGVIQKIGRVWADGEEISLEDLSYSVYFGDDQQQPDPVISAIEGAENTPAFRGTAYIVFEDLQLAEYGNRIPQLNFEVFRRANSEVISNDQARDVIKGVCLIPGTGEYSLSPDPLYFTNEFAENTPANQSGIYEKTDFLRSIEDLEVAAPNCETINLVVSWFGNDLRCQSCSILPKVDQVSNDAVDMAWNVAGLTRSEAMQVSLIDDRPVFGGTPTDQTVIAAIQMLKEKGYRVAFYPFILMDIQDGNALADPWSNASTQPTMPWRGRITLDDAPGRSGTTDKTAAAESEVAAFLGDAELADFSISGQTVSYSGSQDWRYRRFILHYAHLCQAAGGVDIFYLGSELRALTQIRSSQSEFPFVAGLRQLGNDVRSVLGSSAEISYAADWSEYFGYHPDDGSGDHLFHLDPLWSDDQIDFVAIDNYMPLSDWRDQSEHLDDHYNAIYKRDYLRDSVEGGEGFAWYYASQSDREKQIRSNITDGGYGKPWVFRYKDIRAWWENTHINRIGGSETGVATDWVPQSKPIVFSEYGCPAIDKGTNQPNVFVDPKSVESAAPYFSDGNRDTLIQSRAIEVLGQYWQDPAHNPVSAAYGGEMIDWSKSAVWAWDARPYPEFPFRDDLWSDGENFRLGHWLNGRLYAQDLGLVVAEICEASGFTDYDVSDLDGLVDGLLVDQVASARQILQDLMVGYGFTAFEQDGKIVFAMQNSATLHALEADELVKLQDPMDVAEFTREPPQANIERHAIRFWNKDADYEAETLENRDAGTEGAILSETSLPLSMDITDAAKIAQRLTRKGKVSRQTTRFSLPQRMQAIALGDLVKLGGAGQEDTYRITNIDDQGTREVEAIREEDDPKASPDIRSDATYIPNTSTSFPVSGRFLDIPVLHEDHIHHAPYFAAAANPFPSAVALYHSTDGASYTINSVHDRPSVFGVTLESFATARPGLWQPSTLRMRVSDPSRVVSEPLLDVLNGANAFVITHPDHPDAEIAQFQKASLQADGSLLLGDFLRGQLGTEAFIPQSWPAGAEVTFLSTVPGQIEHAQGQIGIERSFRYGPLDKAPSHDSYVATQEVFQAVGLRPYAPVHLRTVSNADGDIAVSWIRRTRIGGDVWEAYDVPLGEDREIYQAEVWSGSQMLRSTTVESPSWTYLRSDQIADGATGAVQIEIAQISTVTGPGAKGRITIYVWHLSIRSAVDCGEPIAKACDCERGFEPIGYPDTVAICSNGCSGTSE